MRMVPSEFRKFRAASCLFAVLTLSVLFGCSRSAPTPKSNEFFVTWLQGHGESNVVVDAQGVGVAGNPTRLCSSLYGSKRFTNSFTAELEFRVRIPDGREIIEYVAGSGDSLEKAENDPKVNFILSTFHVVYRSFLNPNDPHQTEEKITINGQPRVLVLGDTFARSQTTNSSPDMFPLREHFRKILSPVPLSEQTHWIKIVYANLIGGTVEIGDMNGDGKSDVVLATGGSSVSVFAGNGDGTFPLAFDQQSGLHFYTDVE